MIGADTELDRQILELIKDPLTHMVRNSGDHGIEVPEKRLKAGKPATGTITLNAYHEGGHVIIEISDDGNGIAIDKVKEKILSKQLATQAEIDEKTVVPGSSKKYFPAGQTLESWPGGVYFGETDKYVIAQEVLSSLVRHATVMSDSNAIKLHFSQKITLLPVGVAKDFG